MCFSVIDRAVETTESNGSLVLTINRPEAGNSMSLEAARAMRSALADCRDRADLRSVVITGAGGKFFCTGGDLKAYRALETPDQLAETFGLVREMLFEIEQHPLPVIAAIDGYALGGGAELALACDVRFATEGATIGFPQANLGLIPGWNGTERLVATVGKPMAMRLLLEARRVPARQALALGLIDHVVETGSALDYCLAYSAQLHAAPLAARAVKAAVQACKSWPGPDVTSQLFETLWFTADHREAELAFVEKRQPLFKGE